MDGNISYKLEPYRNYHNPITCLASLQPSSPPIVVSPLFERGRHFYHESVPSPLESLDAPRSGTFHFFTRGTSITVSESPRGPPTFTSCMIHVCWMYFFVPKVSRMIFFFPCTRQGNAVLSMNRLNFAKSRDRFISIHININISFTFLGKYLLW